jgi:hypothetical protein
MRNALLASAAVAVVIIAGVAIAQPMPPGPGPDGGPPHGMMGMMRHMGGPGEDGPRWPGQRMFNPRDFGLVYQQADKQLSPADVQKIAEAFLLWRGNHSWKVTDVKPQTDGTVGFAVSMPDGAAIAHFTMDPHTGRVTRKD